MKILKEIQDKMEEDFEDLLFALDEFKQNPTGRNRRILLSEIFKFSSTKNKLAARVRNMSVKWEKPNAR